MQDDPIEQYIQHQLPGRIASLTVGKVRCEHRLTCIHEEQSRVVDCGTWCMPYSPKSLGVARLSTLMNAANTTKEGIVA